ncbi:MAG: glutamate-5-semialdehyde dehydrogenase [Trichlorobacter sp.]|jgi:glutamate-5-semialdehyde dehydrogenase
MTISEQITSIAQRARDASTIMAKLSTNQKNTMLHAMADLLEAESAFIITANAHDLDSGKEKGLSEAMIDRLMLNKDRIAGIAASLREVAALPDPVGEITSMNKRPSGIQVGRMRIPLGVIGIVYEARPNVTADAAALCLKAGNAVILRGGSEAIHSNKALADILHRAMRSSGIPTEALALVPMTDREGVLAMLQQEESIDLIIPRGGESLIRFVVQHSRIPVIKHYKGVCHAFIDASADAAMATEIIVNGKTQRPGVCNALETVLIHRDVAETVVPILANALLQRGVELRGDEEFCQFVSTAKQAKDEDWDAEYLALILSCKIVGSIDEAIGHIERHGSLHSEVIITNDYTNAQRFIREVNSSCVLVNASTRFNDGGQLGLGAEIGISTTKLHSFGPMGLEDLTTRKYIVFGEGQVRG